MVKQKFLEIFYGCVLWFPVRTDDITRQRMREVTNYLQKRFNRLIHSSFQTIRD
jgi:hypothetical protein